MSHLRYTSSKRFPGHRNVFPHRSDSFEAASPKWALNLQSSSHQGAHGVIRFTNLETKNNQRIPPVGSPRLHRSGAFSPKVSDSERRAQLEHRSWISTVDSFVRLFFFMAQIRSPCPGVGSHHGVSGLPGDRTNRRWIGPPGTRKHIPPQRESRKIDSQDRLWLMAPTHKPERRFNFIGAWRSGFI